MIKLDNPRSPYKWALCVLLWAVIFTALPMQARSLVTDTTTLFNQSFNPASFSRSATVDLNRYGINRLETIQLESNPLAAYSGGATNYNFGLSCSFGPVSYNATFAGYGAQIPMYNRITATGLTRDATGIWWAAQVVCSVAGTGAQAPTQTYYNQKIGTSLTASTSFNINQYPSGGYWYLSSAKATVAVSYYTNQPPDVSMTINGVTAKGNETKSTSLSKNDTIAITFAGSDADGNYERTHVWVYKPSIGNWQELCNSTAPNGTVNYTITTIEPHQFHARSTDDYGWDSTTAIINIDVPNRPPTVTMTANNVAATEGNPQTLSVKNGTTLNFSFSASDSDDNYAYTQMWVLGGSYTNWTELYNKSTPTGNATFTLNGIGNYQFHCRSTDAFGASSQTAIINVTSENNPPSINWTRTQTTLDYGQTMQVTTTAQDADGNLCAIYIDLDGIPHRYDSFDAGLRGDGKFAVMDSYACTPDPGVHTFKAKALDSAGGISGEIACSVTVNKATPTVQFAPQSFGEDAPLNSSQLSAHFTNPNDGNTVPADGVSYTIVNGGNAVTINGSVVTPGMKLPAGVYTIRVILPASSRYNAVQADALFTVITDPNGDFNGNGLTNEEDAKLGLNPYQTSENNPAALEMNIHTPTREN